jgi:predicted ATPase with chaperone activity
MMLSSVKAQVYATKIMSAKVHSIITLAPADVPKDDSSFDLAIAAVTLVAAKQVKHHFTPDEALLGELGLDGVVRPVRSIIGKLLAGQARGITIFQQLICSRHSWCQASHSTQFTN